MSKIKMVCKDCGSENILCDSFATWNVETQQWELHSFYDETVCNDCGAVDSATEVVIST